MALVIFKEHLITLIYFFSDSLASDSDSYLKQKLGETERELDAAERKVKDLQLRLKRFAKDDQIKDEKIFQMEREVKELSDQIKKLEQSIAESRRENNNNATVQASANKQDSKVCVILWLFVFHIFISIYFVKYLHNQAIFYFLSTFYFNIFLNNN